MMCMFPIVMITTGLVFLCVIAAELGRFFAELSPTLLFDLEYYRVEKKYRKLNKRARALWFDSIRILRLIQQHFFILRDIDKWRKIIDIFIYKTQQTYGVRNPRFEYTCF